MKKLFKLSLVAQAVQNGVQNNAMHRAWVEHERNEKQQTEALRKHIEQTYS